MRLGYFEGPDGVFRGVVRGETVYPLPDGFYGAPAAGSGYTLANLKALAPCRPSKIVCVGLNYRDHAAELGYPLPGEPVLFIKPSTTVIADGEAIIYPAAATRVDYEAELAVVVGKTASKVNPEAAADYILGYTGANDVTARDLQQKDGRWTRAKSYDTFCPLGPYIVTEFDPSDRRISLYVKGERKQHSSTKHLVFDVYTLLSFISQIMTLNPEDVILTGTPAGVGPLKFGDKVTVDIQGIGRLSNYIVAEVDNNNTGAKFC
jgi:2-keto-4-pentenoate hydratase/2-oxohepta-3-ene-1,7-dioic acid hydratase in catechol pathway